MNIDKNIVFVIMIILFFISEMWESYNLRKERELELKYSNDNNSFSNPNPEE